MDSLNENNVRIGGRLAFRLEKNAQRLNAPEYLAPEAFRNSPDWPGDWVGRALLAKVMESRVLPGVQTGADGIVARLPAELNEKGYLGEIAAPGTVNEQALAGHSWLMRGLLEYGAQNGAGSTRKLLEGIVENLYLPAAGAYGRYPLNEKRARFAGKAAGEITESENGWVLSSDVGCAYISFDALSQYYETFRDERVGRLLDEMFRTFSGIDAVESSLQTHASLSAARGIVRYYRCTGRPELLAFARRMMDVYVRSGMTENYANFNWFRRPEWTEPCAEIDSFLLAGELFKLTKEPKYLDIMQKVYYNSIVFAQRENGGFGCDSCVCAAPGHEFLNAGKTYEAKWCCSMRGGEGLTYAALNSVLQERDEAWLCFYRAGTYRLENCLLTVRTDYPEEGEIRLNVSGFTGKTTLHLAVPAWDAKPAAVLTVNGEETPARVRDGFISLTLAGGSEITLKLGYAPVLKPALTGGTGAFTVWQGVRLLARETEGNETVRAGELRFLPDNTAEARGERLVPLDRSIEYPKEELLRKNYQVIFRE